MKFIYYFFIVYVMRLLFFIASFFNEKIKRGIEARKDWETRYEKYFKNRKDEKRVWIHVSSVGELEQAKTIINLFKENDKDLSVVLTFFSPSVENMARKMDVSFSDYLPLDSYFNAKKLFDLIKPSALIFVKYDIWPGFIWEGYKRGVKLFLIDATLHKRSKRYDNFFGKLLYSNIYSCFNFIGVVSKKDYERFRVTYSSRNNVFLIGDTKFDRAFQRSLEFKNKTPNVVLKKAYGKFNIIFGSTWEYDDKIVLNPIKEVLTNYDEVSIFIAPHEPNKKRVDNYINFFKEFNPLKFTEIRNELSRVVIIDTVGILAELYSIGSFAYVGGGFSTGVHNILEPAIMKIPVCFGPFHYNAPEAEAMTFIGCGFRGESEYDFKKIFDKLINNREQTKDLGLKANEFIKNNLGAALKYYKIIKKELDK